MDITMLGTGNAAATECYNTCFVLSEGNRFFMVDGGGGNGILRQLRHAGFRWQDMRDIFVTHRHSDHILGIVWMIRMFCQYMSRGEYEGEVRIYAHAEVADILRAMAGFLLRKPEADCLGRQLRLIEVEDGGQFDIIGRRTEFFDIGSEKTTQYGFCMGYARGKRLVCCGDEPCRARTERYAEGADWLLHEAFCLYSQADRFRPYDKFHSTVKDACETAERLRVKNLLLYHTEDENLSVRKALYLAEGKKHYSGGIYVPDDLERLTL